MHFFCKVSASVHHAGELIFLLATLFLFPSHLLHAQSAAPCFTNCSTHMKAAESRRKRSAGLGNLGQSMESRPTDYKPFQRLPS